MVVPLLVLLAGCSPTTVVPVARAAASQGGELFGGVLAGGTISDADWNRVVNATLQSIVRIHNTGCGFTATGSGFVVRPGVVVTNRHVVEDARSLSLDLPGSGTVPVASWSVSTVDDLALLQVPSLTTPALPVSDETLVPGDLVTAIGYPLGGAETVRRGRVTSVTRSTEDDGVVVTTTSPVLPGNSGGPLIDTDGHVVGVVFAIARADDSTLVLPVDRLRRLLSDPAATRPAEPCR